MLTHGCFADADILSHDAVPVGSLRLGGASHSIRARLHPTLGLHLDVVNGMSADLSPHVNAATRR